MEPGQERVLPAVGQALRPLEQVMQETQRIGFMGKVVARQQAFGSSQDAVLALDSRNLMAASFLGFGEAAEGSVREQRFAAPAGTDLSRFAERGDAVLLAWAPGHAPITSLRRFPAVRTSQGTYYRLVIPAGRPPSSP
jgi:hypothetical protein